MAYLLNIVNNCCFIGLLQLILSFIVILGQTSRPLRCRISIDEGFSWIKNNTRSELRFHFNPYDLQCATHKYFGNSTLNPNHNEFATEQDCADVCSPIPETLAKGRLLMMRMEELPYDKSYADPESAGYKQLKRDIQAMISETMRSFDDDAQLQSSGWNGKYRTKPNELCNNPWSNELLSVMEGSTVLLMGLTPPGGVTDISKQTAALAGLSSQANRKRRNKRQTFSDQPKDTSGCIEDSLRNSNISNEQAIDILKRNGNSISVKYNSFKEFCVRLEYKYNTDCHDIGPCNREFCTAYAYRCLETPLESIPWRITDCGCDDLNLKCCFWASINECSKNPKFMAENCPKSCGTCDCQETDKSRCTIRLSADCRLRQGQVGVPVNGELRPQPKPADNQCADKYKSCCGWQRKNECEVNPFWMRVNCPESCGTCGCTGDRALAGSLCQPMEGPSVCTTRL